MKIVLVLGGVLVGGLLWIGIILRRRWHAPFEDVVPRYKHPALRPDPRERLWDHERWK